MDGLGAADDAKRGERSSQTGAVAEEAYPLALEGSAVDVADQASKTAPDAAAVHVTAHGGNLDGRVDALLEALLGETHEGLLNNLVGEGLGVVHVANLRGNIGESRALGVSEVVVVEETSVRLGDQLAGGSVESQVVETVEGGLGESTLGRAISVAVRTLGEKGLTLVVGAIGGIESLGVAVDRIVSVNIGVLAGKVGLVEIVGVGHVAATKTGLEDNRGVRADQESDGASAAGRTSIALGIESDITSNNKTVPAIPGGGLDPVNGVENSVGATIASVDSVDTLDVGVVAKQLHQNRLDGLGLVEDGLGTDLEAADRVGVDIVVLEELGNNGKGERVDV